MIKLKGADLFCGSGGFTTGAMRAAGRLGITIDMLAINHWQTAVDSHTANHPAARHMCKDLNVVDPHGVAGKLGLLLASPECTNHSDAKGSMVLDEHSRAGGWHVVRWAEVGRPERIVVENVTQFKRWGPLNKNGRPNKRKEGQTFNAFLIALESLGYRVEHRILNSADFGAATSRERLFIQAWRGYRRPTWPEPSRTRENWRPASEIIDWSLPGQSIYNRKKPLSPNTMRRIYAGLERYSGIPFTFLVTHKKDGRPRPVSEPLNTITTAKGGEIAMAQPWLVSLRGTAERHLDGSARSVGEPLPVITAGGTHLGLCAPFLQPFVIGQQSCSAPRATTQPLPTIATAGAIQLARPYLTKFYGTGGARPVTEPLDTVTTKGRFGLCQPTIEIEGEHYKLDILFRMLKPHELKQAMSFPKDYVLLGTQEDQIRQVGNAVDVNTAEALIFNALEGVK